jgi:hypothetical protein
VLAAGLALLLLVGASGAARAWNGESIQCCCGRHDAHRACKCPSCPVTKGRARVGTSRVDLARDCDGNSDPGVLAVVAVIQTPHFLVRPIAAPLHIATIQPLSGRLVEAGRPPP